MQSGSGWCSRYVVGVLRRPQQKPLSTSRNSTVAHTWQLRLSVRDMPVVQKVVHADSFIPALLLKSAVCRQLSPVVPKLFPSQLLLLSSRSTPNMSLMLQASTCITTRGSSCRNHKSMPTSGPQSVWTRAKSDNEGLRCPSELTRKNSSATQPKQAMFLARTPERSTDHINLHKGMSSRGCDRPALRIQARLQVDPRTWSS